MAEDKLPMPESRFPMYFEKCPQCGCEETISQLAWEEEAKEGRVGEEFKYQMSDVVITPVLDPNNPPIISLRTVVEYWGTCAKCSYRYCRRADLTISQVKMGPPPGQGMGGPSMPGAPFSKS